MIQDYRNCDKRNQHKQTSKLKLLIRINITQRRTVIVEIYIFSYSYKNVILRNRFVLCLTHMILRRFHGFEHY